MEYLRHQAHLEKVAEDILTNEHLILDLSRRQKENEHAIKSLKQGTSRADKKVHFFAGGLFMKLPKQNAQDLLEADQLRIAEELNRLKESIRILSKELAAVKAGSVEHKAPVA
ncbi:p53 and DNA damage-regulated protein 1 [Gaertneriomyces sp. JEL0708]|nr:p53 and DNA damage-regulated protein 1 [Gaertneriomyces sp. JEL0708]